MIRKIAPHVTNIPIVIVVFSVDVAIIPVITPDITRWSGGWARRDDLTTITPLVVLEEEAKQ